ncbi:MAG: NAD-binding protein [Mycoplasmatales bacterium]
MKSKNILIIGCGESGSESASKLSRAGHNVYVVDKNEKNFVLLHSDFSGIAINQEVSDLNALEEFKNYNLDVIMIVTENDDLNIFLAMLASELLGYENVVTRLFDEDKSCLLKDSSINVIYPSLLAHDAIKRCLGDELWKF